MRYCFYYVFCLEDVTYEWYVSIGVGMIDVKWKRVF